MVTAALMYFDGNASALVRWLAGTHVRGHRNVPALLQCLSDKVDPDTHEELTRM